MEHTLEVNENNSSRPWNLEGTFDTFEEASKAKAVFLEKNSKMQAKIRRRSSKNNFSLKTRLLAEFVEEKPKMGKVNEEIKRLQKEENLTLPQLFEKYPHLARLQFDEMKEEQLSEDKNKQLKLLLD